jgi:hypothetical protein
VEVIWGMSLTFVLQHLQAQSETFTYSGDVRPRADEQIVRLQNHILLRFTRKVGNELWETSPWVASFYTTKGGHGWLRNRPINVIYSEANFAALLPVGPYKAHRQDHKPICRTSSQMGRFQNNLRFPGVILWSRILTFEKIFTKLHVRKSD